MRVLIVDFDFFTAVGGGQTFYRRVVERHPEMQFLYPSRGPDLRLRAELPSNAEPFALDSDEADPGLVVTLRDAGLPWSDVTLGVTLGAVGRSLQGESLDIVEVPSFRPCAHLVRPLFAAHGIRVGRVSLGLLGWVGMSLRKAGAGPRNLRRSKLWRPPPLQRPIPATPFPNCTQLRTFPMVPPLQFSTCMTCWRSSRHPIQTRWRTGLPISGMSGEWIPQRRRTYSYNWPHLSHAFRFAVCCWPAPTMCGCQQGSVGPTMLLRWLRLWGCPSNTEA